jgi:hypothetical protein
MTSERLSSPMVGSDVYTADGEKLGELKEIEGAAFKVDAAIQLDYWLPLSSVASTAEGRITLSFPWEELGVYKMSAPDDIAGTAAAESPEALDTTSEAQPRGDVIL